MLKITVAGVCLVALGAAACSGGSSESSPTLQPPAANTAPVFSGATSFSLNEGISGAIGTVSVTDPNGDAATFSISGRDGALFSVSSASTSGQATQIELRLGEALDFERPSDGNGDGVYDFTLSASDGQATVSADIAVTINDRSYAQYAPTEIASGLSQPVQAVSVESATGAFPSEIFIVEKGGVIKARALDAADGSAVTRVVADLSGEVTTNGERGLLGLALSPNFETDRTVYVNLTNAPDGDTEVRRYRMQAGRHDLIDLSSEELILRIGQPRSNHNAGWIGFGLGGMLLVPTGDGGGANDPDDLAQDTRSLLGKVLRLDVTADDFPSDVERNYAIPPDNPFADGIDGAPEIYALGLRNPYRNGVDPQDGTLFIADVGQGAREEISVLTNAGAGANFGWPLFEGLRANRGSDVSGLTAPLAEYAHGDGSGQGRSITGGAVVRSPLLPDDEVQFVFADFVSGNLWALQFGLLEDSAPLDAASFAELSDRGAVTLITEGIEQITSVDAAPDGSYYLTTLDGRLFRGDPPVQ